MKRASLGASAALCLALCVPMARGEEVSSKEHKAGKDDKKRFFLIGPAKDAKEPKEGYGLVVILPGGSGGADFLPFGKRLYQKAVPEGYLAAQVVSVKWQKDQEVIWPTDKVKTEGMKFSTEQFIDSVIDEVSARHKLDASRVFTLSWSSSGPAASAASLTSKKVKGSLVATSVFNPRYLPALTGAKGRAYYLRELRPCHRDRAAGLVDQNPRGDVCRRVTLFNRSRAPSLTHPPT